MTTDPTAQPSPTPAWRDRDGDVWTLGDDRLLYSTEHGSFARSVVEWKWGPLDPVPGTFASAAEMSGPEHFRQAESLLGVDWMQEYAASALAAAQVHATLALAAVTAEIGSHSAPPAYHSGGEWEALLHPERTQTDDSTNSADAPWESA